jgi:hypothetical protein
MMALALGLAVAFFVPLVLLCRIMRKYVELTNQRLADLEAKTAWIQQNGQSLQARVEFVSPPKGPELCTKCGKPLTLEGEHTLECKDCGLYWSDVFPPSRLQRFQS